LHHAIAFFSVYYTFAIDSSHHATVFGFGNAFATEKESQYGTVSSTSLLWNQK
jgi:hypothetical protein